MGGAGGSIDFTLPACCGCCCDDACEAELSEDCDPAAPAAPARPPCPSACSAVSSVVGRSMRRWIWMPSPGPMCEMWLKLDGAEISFERRSGLLQILRLDLDSLPVVWLCTICGINHVMFEHPAKDGDDADMGVCVVESRKRL